MDLEALVRDNLHTTALDAPLPRWPALHGIETDPQIRGAALSLRRLRVTRLAAASVLVVLTIGIAVFAHARGDTPASLVTTPGSAVAGSTVPSPASPVPGTKDPGRRLVVAPAPPEPEAAIAARIDGVAVAGSTFPISLIARDGDIAAYRFRPVSLVQRWSADKWFTTDYLVTTPAHVDDLCGTNASTGTRSETNAFTPGDGEPSLPNPSPRPCLTSDFSLLGVPRELHLLPASARAGEYRLCREAIPGRTAAGPVARESIVDACARFTLTAPPLETFTIVSTACPTAIAGPANPEAAKGVTDAEWLARFRDLPEAQRLAKSAELQEARANRKGVMLSKDVVGWISESDLARLSIPMTDPGTPMRPAALPIFDDACTLIGYFVTVPTGAPGARSWESLAVTKDEFDAPGFDARSSPRSDASVQSDVPR